MGHGFEPCRSSAANSSSSNSDNGPGNTLEAHVRMLPPPALASRQSVQVHSRVASDVSAQAYQVVSQASSPDGRNLLEGVAITVRLEDDLATHDYSVSPQKQSERLDPLMRVAMGERVEQ
jgi:hypothetical protein